MHKLEKKKRLFFQSGYWEESTMQFEHSNSSCRYLIDKQMLIYSASLSYFANSLTERHSQMDFEYMNSYKYGIIQKIPYFWMNFDFKQW